MIREVNIYMYEYYKENDNSQQVVNSRAEAERERDNRKMEKKASRKRFWGKVGTGMCVGLAFGIVAGCSYISVTRIANHFFPEKVSESTEVEGKVLNKTDDAINQDKPSEIEAMKPAGEVKLNESDYDVSEVSAGLDVSSIVENAMPSIVSITNKSVQEIMSMWGMGVQQYESTSAGSGIIIGQNDDEILIVTNNHVVADADTLSVGFADDQMYSAYVKGTDSDLDLAVVAVKLTDVSQDTKNAIKISLIGKSDDLKVGEQVVAIGNALGYGQSVTTGIVSAIDRDITEDNVDNPLIQTDAAINPGNSGGALLNMKGELIGINSAKIASTSIEGVGYAIPMESAMPIIESLMNREVREEVDASEAGYIGISGVSVDASTSKAYGIPQGVYVQTVEENSPAEIAGIIKSDVIKKFDGITVSSISDIRDKLNYYKEGEQVDIQLYRLVDGEYAEKVITVTLGSRKGTALDPEKNSSNENSSSDKKDDEEDSSDGSREDNQRPNGYYSESEIQEFFNQMFGR